MSADPVSWFLIEAGWSVAGSDGSDLGKVHEVVGDSGKDIFNGLAVSPPGLFKGSRYVPAERVAEIVEGAVTLAMNADEFEQLDEHGAVPPSAEVRVDTTDLAPD